MYEPQWVVAFWSRYFVFGKTNSGLDGDSLSGFAGLGMCGAVPRKGAVIVPRQRLGMTTVAEGSGTRQGMLSCGRRLIPGLGLVKSKDGFSRSPVVSLPTIITGYRCSLFEFTMFSLNCCNALSFDCALTRKALQMKARHSSLFMRKLFYRM